MLSLSEDHRERHPAGHRQYLPWEEADVSGDTSHKKQLPDTRVCLGTLGMPAARVRGQAWPRPSLSPSAPVWPGSSILFLWGAEGGMYRDAYAGKALGSLYWNRSHLLMLFTSD